MDEVLNLYKTRGETPLACIDRFRENHPQYKHIPLSYAGRLDPMAEGVLPILVGEANKRRGQYLNLDKEYICDVLFGFSTDTYDILGELTNAVTRSSHKHVGQAILSEYLAQMGGTRTQKYPPFSSKPLEGTPLFVKARMGQLDEFELPDHEVTIRSLTLVGHTHISQEDLLTRILTDVRAVKGDFRQEKIATLWHETLRILYGLSFDVASIGISCSSGTYVRSLAHELGVKLGVPALAYRILRTKVGNWKVGDALR